MEEKTPLVSVVMSCYNAEAYLCQAIDSILAQTFHDFEFIVWDDGSIDRTAEIVKSYSDPRIRYFYHSNSGLGATLRFACEKARGKYIARMDADDVALPERLAKEVAYMERHEECVLLSCGAYYINEQNEVLGLSFPCMSNRVLKKKLRVNNPFLHPGAIFRREAYMASGGYYPIRFCEDWVLFSRLAKQGEVHNLGLSLMKYRILRNSLGHSMDGNPYKSILFSYLSFFCKHRILSEEDFQTYNALYERAKSCNMTDIKHRRNFHIYNKAILQCLSVFLGKKYAYFAVLYVKNIYARIR